MAIDKVSRILDERVGGWPLLEHPFYKAWTAGTLTKTDLAFYSTQYWRQVEAFPGYLEAIASRLGPGRARDVVTDNLRDEVDGDHARLWVDFSESLGVSRDELDRSAPEPETRACVSQFDSAAQKAPLPFALGMLYGYESQTPAVATTKAEGLRRHYGIDGDGTRYFELHGQLDVLHAGELAGAIEDVASDDSDLSRAAAGAEAGARAVWGLLDGVIRSQQVGAC